MYPYTVELVYVCTFWSVHEKKMYKNNIDYILFFIDYS